MIVARIPHVWLWVAGFWVVVCVLLMPLLWLLLKLEDAYDRWRERREYVSPIVGRIERISEQNGELVAELKFDDLDTLDA